MKQAQTHTYTGRRTGGYIVLLAVVFFAVLLAFSAAMAQAMSTYVGTQRRSIATAQALALAEAGVDQALYQLNQNALFTGETVSSLPTGTFTTAVTSVDSATRRIVSTGVSTYHHQTITKEIAVLASIDASIVSFHYGVQAGPGGFTLENSSSITGNAFSAGPIVGSGGSTNCNTASGTGNCIYGDIVSTGPSGAVYGIHATGSAYAHTVGSASVGTTIERDAHYTDITNTTVRGVSYPGSADPAPAALPISDSQIADWEAQAEAGGVISSCDGSGNYTINSSVSIGPVKITCNVIIKSSSAVITVGGHIWVTGNITTQTGPTIRMASSLGSQNVAIIADNPANPTGSGSITVGQSTVFQNSGTAGSFVFLISQNSSAENGGTMVALDLSQGASAMVAYAAHGLASLSQSVSVKEVTAYKIVLSQSANVVYDSGLPNSLFETGPGGSWTYSPGSYVIIH